MIEEPVEDNVEEDKGEEDITYLPESDEENDFEYSADGDKLAYSSEPLEQALTNQLNPDVENINEPQPYIEQLMSKGWTLMADREKDHKFCVRHMYAYFKLGLKDINLEDLMQTAARLCTTADIKKFMELVKKEMPKFIDGFK